MMGIKNIELDLRKLGMADRHSKIFSTWNSLSEGDSLLITNDHDPKPLQFMLKAESKSEFGWTYKKEGPDEWVIEIKKLASKDEIGSGERWKREELKKMLKRLHEVKPEELDIV